MGERLAGLVRGSRAVTPGGAGWLFVGVALRYGLFADHRSGWSGLMLRVGLVFWSFEWVVVCWRNPPPDGTRVLSLREVFEREHGRHKLVPAEDDPDGEASASFMG